MNNFQRRQWQPTPVLVWQIPWTEEPSRLQSMGSLGVGHNWATSLPLFTFMHWRRKWQPTPVFFPGESQEQGSLVGCRLWGHTESDTTEATQQQQQHEQLYVHKLITSTEQINFLERHNLPTLTLKKKSLTIPIKEIEFIINPAQQKATGPGGFTNKFYQTFKEEIIQILYNLFQRIEAEGIPRKLFHVTTLTLTLKLDKNVTRKVQTNISHEHRCKT